MVWMNSAALPEFRKLWGKINGLSVGKYKLIISSNYHVWDFSGEKYVILSTHSSLGGKSDFLGIIACVIGSTAVIGSFLFFFVDYRERKN